MSVRQELRWGIVLLIVFVCIACTPEQQAADTCVAAGLLSTAERFSLRERFSVTNAYLCAYPAQTLRTALQVARQAPEVESAEPAGESEETDATGGAAPDVAWLRSRLQDENGTIPADGLAVAQQHIRRMQQVQGRTAALGRNQWQSLGPGNIGGRIRSLIVHPATPTIMYAGGVHGGIWKTTNGGASWAPLDDFLPNLGVTALVFDPRDADIIWAGTGEYDIGGGIYRSTDAGDHWMVVPGTSGSAFSIIRRMTATVRDGLTVLTVATTGGIYRTTDVGAHWTQAQSLNADTTLANLWDIDPDPTQPDNMVASSDVLGAHIWYSRDAGLHWAVADVDVAVAGRIELAYAASDASIIYASVEGGGGSLYKSSDGGVHFVLVNNHRLLSQGWHNNALWIDPTDPNRLLFGAVDVYRSADGGATVEKISDWARWPFSAHADQHWFVASSAFNGTTNRTVYVSNDGGIYRMSDYRNVSLLSGWEELNNTLGVTQFYSVAGNPLTGDLIGGTQDNGNLINDTRSSDQDWYQAFGGDGGYVAVDQRNPQLQYHEYVHLNLMKRRNTGTGQSDIISGEYVSGGTYLWKPSPYLIPDAKTMMANFIAPFALDPNVSNTMLVGGFTLWRTTTLDAAVTNSSGPTWYAIKTGSYSPLSAIAVAPGHSDIIWVANSVGGLWKSTNGTAAPGSVLWTEVSTPLPNRSLNDIWIDPADENHVIVVFGGFSPDNIWGTKDGGGTWSALVGSGATALPSIPVYTLSVYPAKPTWLYAGTELGLFASEDNGAHWAVSSEGPANAAVYDSTWLGSQLVIATFGRGVYGLDVAPPQVKSVQVSGAGAMDVVFTVRFNKTVTGVAASDFAVTKTGNVAATIQLVTGSGTTYAVLVRVTGGTGLVSLGMAQTATIQDVTGQVLDPLLSISSPTCSAVANAVLCTTVVTSRADSGVGSLRQILADASPGDTVVFGPEVTGQTIQLASQLHISKDVTIDAQANNAQIIIDGGSTTGLVKIDAGATVTLVGVHLAHGSAFNGAAIENAGTLIVRDSSITASNATVSGAALLNNGTAIIVNSTIYSNIAFSGAVIANEQYATLSLVNATISGNTSNSYTLVNIGALTIQNTIIADSVGGDCYSSSFYGTLVSTASLVEDRSCAATVWGDPKLGAAAINGGTTYTKALLVGSKAIDAGDDSVCAAAPVRNLDQRGVVRPIGNVCDIGAYEASVPQPSLTVTRTLVRSATATRTTRATVTPTRSRTPTRTATKTRTRTRTATPRPPVRTMTLTPTRRVP